MPGRNAVGCAVVALGLFASNARADELQVSWPVDVTWDPKGAFLFSSAGVSRYDVRTSAVTQADAEGSVALSASRESPDHAALAGVKLNPNPRATTWKDGVFTADKKGDHKLLVTRGDKSFEVASVDAVATAEAYWSPDGHYVAFVVRSTLWQGMDGSSMATAYVGASGPRVQVLAAKDVLAGARDGAVKAVEGAGGIVVYAGPAKKARDKTVIYAAAGSEALGKAIAKAVPGGATVEALSWEASAEVVVALGKSALKGGK